MTNGDMLEKLSLMNNNTEEGLGFNDNPFDVLIHSACECFRTWLYISRRYDTNNYHDELKDAEHWTFMCNTVIKVLKTLSEDDLRSLRNLSVYYNKEKFDSLNDMLLKIERDLPTVFSHVKPIHSKELETLLHGKEYADKLQNLQLRFTKLLFKYNLTAQEGKQALYWVDEVKIRQDGDNSAYPYESKLSEMVKELIDDDSVDKFEVEYMLSYADKLIND